MQHSFEAHRFLSFGKIEGQFADASFGQACPYSLAKTSTGVDSIFANFQRNRMEIIMRALYDHNGQVGIWLDDDEKWLLDLHGNALAIVHEGSIYDLRGHHAAWWRGDRIQDHYGNVIFVTRDFQHLQTLSPLWHLRPLPPIEKIKPTRPTLGLRPIESQTRGRWVDPQSFLNDLRGIRST
jgi:hypothetical protein